MNFKPSDNETCAQAGDGASRGRDGILFIIYFISWIAIVL